MAYHFEAWQWLAAGFAAFLVGLSKTGIPGIGLFAVVIFANLIDPKLASGVVLPILISADLIAASAYRKSVAWKRVGQLFPWAALGVIAGYFALKQVDGHAVGRMMGVIILAMIGIHLWRKKNAGEEPKIPEGLWFAVLMGLIGGFTTMVGNAAGPVMILYLLAMRLPKLEFLGTGAWYFFLMNSFKVPFSVNLGLINAHSLLLDLPLMGIAMLGALSGRKLVPYLNQEMFETLALIFSVIAAVKLLF